MLEQEKFDNWKRTSRYLADSLWPEGAHQLVTQFSQLLAEWRLSRKVVGTICERIYGSLGKADQIELFWDTYKSSIGLGAGVIKEPLWLDLWSKLPFGWIELWGIQGKAQAGNPPQRVWRHDDEMSVQNFYGLPTTGVKAISEKLWHLKQLGRLPDNLWANLWNSATTVKDQDKIDEFAMMVETIFPYVKVIVLNFSCPNQEEWDRTEKEQIWRQKI